MNEIAIFYLLKEKVLATFKLSFPYFTGNIHDFGNKEIAQLQELIEEKQKQRVSEKWVYTHLKPKKNEKLPRKDMLDILSVFSGFQSWDQFSFFNNEKEIVTEVEIKKDKKKYSKQYMSIGIITVAIGIFLVLNQFSEPINTICFKDKYTQKNIEDNKIEVFLLNKKSKEKQNIKNGCLHLKSEENNVQLIIESVYYKKDTITVTIKKDQTNYDINLNPDDYAMMLRTYMNSDLKNWNQRKTQLQNIIDDNAEIEEIMFDEIGVEFLNKEDFINKITTPSETVKQMEIIEILYKNEKIISIKYLQK